MLSWSPRSVFARGIAPLTVGLALVLAACSAGESADPVETTDPVETSAEPSTSEAPATSAEPTTEATITPTAAPAEEAAGEGAAAAPPTEPSFADTTTTTVVAPAPTEAPTPPATSLPPLGPTNRVPVSPTASPLLAVGGADGAETARIQQRLLELGFWLGVTNGDYELTTSQAVMAFQKYVGLPASGNVDQPTADTLSAMTLRAFGHADSGTILEVDKARQILMYVIDGRTHWVFNTSTGNGQPYSEEDQNSPGTIVDGVSLTPDGLHKVNRERPEGWWEGDLGRIYRPKYFVGGVAVHGSGSVPNYPASHGCVRVTIQAMDFIWESGLMPVGLPVWVHQNAAPVA